jgi:site-specific recombinase XerD
MKVTTYSISRRYLKSRGFKTWYGRIKVPGKPVRWISLGTTSKTEADLWLRSAMTGRWDPHREAVSLHSAAIKFLGGISASKGKDSATHAAYAQRIGWLTDWCDGQGIGDLDSLDFSKMSDYSLWLGEKYAPKTHREALRVVKQFCRWAAKAYGLTNWDPCALVVGPKLVKRSKDFWTAGQVDSIIAHAPDRDTAVMWAFCGYAGLRFAEAVNVMPSDVSGGMLKVIGKGNKESFVPVSDKLKSMLPDEWDFSRLRNNCVQNKVLQRTCESLGIEGHANLHKFRHSFASNLIRAGVNVKAVQQLMRHENVNITLDTYSHLLQDDLSDAANKV